MPDHSALLQNLTLQAGAEVVVPAAIFLVIVLIGLVLTRRTSIVEDDGLEAEARRWIEDRIDEHVDSLADAYGEAGTGADADELPPAFAASIESFIAEILLPQRDGAEVDLDLGLAIREFVVLRRAELYEEVATRTRRHLAAA